MLRKPLPETVALGEAITRDPTDAMWVATRDGLWRVRYRPEQGEASIDRITVEDGHSSNITRSVVAERDGNVWIGIESGLHRLSPRNAAAITDVGVGWRAMAFATA